MENNEYLNNSQTTLSGQGGTSTKTERLGEKASEIGERVSDKVCEVKSQVRDKAVQARENASRSIDRMSLYLREKNSSEMVEDLQTVIRRHPGKSLLSGLFIGLLVGRIMR